MNYRDYLRKCLLSLVFLLAATTLPAQRNVIDSNYDGRFLFINGETFQDAWFSKPPGGKVILLIQDTTGKGKVDTLSLRLIKYKDTLPVVEGILLDSLVIQNFFRNIVYSILRDKAGRYQLRLLERRDEAPSEEGDNNTSQAEALYAAELTLDTSLTVQNSILTFVIRRGSFRYDSLVKGSGERELFNLRTEKMEFTRPVKLINNNFLAFSIENTRFRDTAIIMFNDNFDYMKDYRGRLFTPRFKECIFDAPAIFSANKIYREYLFNYHPYTFEYFSGDRDIYLKKLRFENVIFNNDVIFQVLNLKNIQFINTTFGGRLFLNNKLLDSCTFTSCLFMSVLDLRNAVFKNKSSLRGSFFQRNSSVLISKDDQVENYDIDIASFEKVFFIIDWGWKDKSQYIAWDDKGNTLRSSGIGIFPGNQQTDLFDSFTERDLETVRLKLQYINEYIKANFKDDDIFGSNKQRVSNWLFYQLSQYQLKYYKKNNRLRYYWLRFTEATVNFGYQGEGKFFRICFFLIFLFAFVFRKWFSNEISRHLGKEEPAPEADIAGVKTKVTPAKKWFFNLDLFKAFFFSFVIFFSVKFPSSYFKFSRGLLSLILIEWFLGIFFIILFLVYIAGNYPIIAKLLGL